ncbi:hypothetical protein [Arthrospiribacter ruber]|jgi:hypothetical protein|uniref:Uncharacterized protein n=1 Tax=Arthrospiribacter ruber TaxID=2487934 RepID=A0A951IZT7_9BACT|nr:hypothetical protein [Arthrospiribacter ruber]MBW3469933.1 hypothetical protein [Arthrospiribacter ruber]
MKLTKDQIEQLKKLISYKGYPEIDVQYEILDHVACKVEELMENNPELSIPDAFQKVHASFGIFGFSDLEESYKKMIEKRLLGYFWTELKSSVFSLNIISPILLTFCYFQSAYVIEKNFSFGEGSALMIGFLFLVIVVLWWYYAFSKDFKKYKNYASWRGNQGILMFTYIPLQFMIQGYRYFGNFNLLEPFTLSLWQIFAVIFVFGGMMILSVLPAVFRKSLEDTKKLEAVYETA